LTGNSSLAGERARSARAPRNWAKNTKGEGNDFPQAGSVEGGDDRDELGLGKKREKKLSQCRRERSGEKFDIASKKE